MNHHEKGKRKIDRNLRQYMSERGWPPVEAPIAMTSVAACRGRCVRSSVTASAESRLLAGLGASGNCRANTGRGEPLDFRSARGCVIGFIRETSLNLSRNSLSQVRTMPGDGLSSTSTAPAAMASKVRRTYPRLTEAETIKIGVGQCAMIDSVAARPSITGMAMSMVITLGCNR
jgi:hypothetical protein